VLVNSFFIICASGPDAVVAAAAAVRREKRPICILLLSGWNSKSLVHTRISDTLKIFPPVCVDI
jgi:hypothetical protein